MRRVFSVVAVCAAFLLGAAGARAQNDDSWVQIEARPTLAEAQDRATAYSGAFGNVAGFRLSSGWYAIALGPYPADEAARQLALLRGERLIPGDSFIPPSGTFGARFWPADPATSAVAAAAAPPPAATPPAESASAEPLTDPSDPAESLQEARTAEAALSAQDRQDVQTAMQFLGIYQGAIDGSFGPGTRAAMAAWQGQNGHEETGILTSAERKALIDGWHDEVAALGLTRVSEPEAGIDIDLPMGLVSFDRYTPPFVAYKPNDGSGYQILLISRRGDARTLTAIYDQVRSLALVPLDGERSLRPVSFTITGAGAETRAYAEATLAAGLVKGFVLVWPASDQDRAARILDAMKKSFSSQVNVALDPDLGQPSSVSRADLTSGLDIRRPTLSRTGIFIDHDGAVLTTAEVLRQCGRVTLNGSHAATVAFQDDTLGIAVLKPDTPLAPRAVAELAPALPAAPAEVAVAGYSYEDKLDAPVVSFGRLAEGKGLNGEPDMARLAIHTLPGDAGGAVLDQSGAMTGLLLPAAADASRQLPPGVAFALNATDIATSLAGHGLTLSPRPAGPPLALEDLAAHARDMTVLVSCWQ